MKNICRIDKCGLFVNGHMLCTKHYKRWIRYGDTSFVKIIRKDTLGSFWKFTNKEGEIPKHLPELGKCWVWTGHCNKDGYGAFRWNNGGRAHRFSYNQFVEPLAPGDKVLHKCDNPSCVNPKHLMKGTQRDNIHDMERKKRSNHPFGEDNGLAKLNAESVKNIRKKYVAGSVDSIKSLAIEYKVSPQNIRSIIARKTWAWIK